MICFPNAKINIGLSVLGKRPDGYHNIESVFYPIPVTDILELIPSEKLSFHISGLPIPGDQKTNLCLKAFHLLKREFQIPNVEIRLHKIIPMGAGLGGGSANGAFTLTLLNDLFKLNLSSKTMEEFALELGSDCPFFIENTPKFVSGRGEIMEPLKIDLKGYWLLLVNPGIHISTQKAYELVQPSKTSADLKTQIQRPLSSWKKTIVNDFEKAELEAYPEMSVLFEKIDSKALYTSVTGSGSSIYGLFEEPLNMEITCFHKWIKL